MFHNCECHTESASVEPTHVYMCLDCRDGAVTCFPSGDHEYTCDIQQHDVVYIGCLNAPGFGFPDYNRYGDGFDVKDLRLNCFDADGNKMDPNNIPAGLFR